MELADVTGEPYDEKRFMKDFWYYHRAPANCLTSYGIGLAELRKLRGGSWTEAHGGNPVMVLSHQVTGRSLWLSHWLDLGEIPNFGEISFLHLVNFARSKGIELDWFSDFDEVRWVALEGRHREPPAKQEPGK